MDSVKVEDLMDSDPDIEFIENEKDSGMSSLGGSKDETPERKAVVSKPASSTDIENYDDEPEETFIERLWGLTEMFPDPVRRVVGAVTDTAVTGVKGIYGFSCNATWVIFSTSVILFAPVIFETERATMEEMQKSQQKQVLLGPGSAIAAGGGSSGALMPPMQR